MEIFKLHIFKSWYSNHHQNSKLLQGLDHFIYKLSRGEISVANFIHPADGASLGSFFKCIQGCMHYYLIVTI